MGHACHIPFPVPVPGQTAHGSCSSEPLSIRAALTPLPSDHPTLPRGPGVERAGRPARECRAKKRGCRAIMARHFFDRIP